jgi:hypothetical protein
MGDRSRRSSVSPLPVRRNCRTTTVWAGGLSTQMFGGAKRSRSRPRAVLRDRVPGYRQQAAHLKPRNPRIARMMTIAPTHQTILFTVCSSHQSRTANASSARAPFSREGCCISDNSTIWFHCTATTRECQSSVRAASGPINVGGSSSWCGRQRRRADSLASSWHRDPARSAGNRSASVARRTLRRPASRRHLG